MKIVEKYTKGNKELRIYHEKYPKSRRFRNNLGKMICFRSRYKLGDEHNFDTPEDFEEFIKDVKAVILPLLLYDHSGITINTTGFSGEWDSGKVGYIYCNYERIKKEYGCKYVTQKVIKRVKEYLVNEIKTYDQYFTGNIYFFEVVEKIKCDECGYTHENVLGTRGGFYGTDWKDNSLLENAGIETLDGWEVA